MQSALIHEAPRARFIEQVMRAGDPDHWAWKPWSLYVAALLPAVLGYLILQWLSH